MKPTSQYSVAGLRIIPWNQRLRRGTRVKVSFTGTIINSCVEYPPSQFDKTHVEGYRVSVDGTNAYWAVVPISTVVVDEKA